MAAFTVSVTPTGEWEANKHRRLSMGQRSPILTKGGGPRGDTPPIRHLWHIVCDMGTPLFPAHKYVEILFKDYNSEHLPFSV